VWSVKSLLHPNELHGIEMEDFEGVLTEDELGNVVTLLRAWQE
jgi:hypothetical protein